MAVSRPMACRALMASTLPSLSASATAMMAAKLPSTAA
jgi:hypothetical protein